MIPLYVHLSPAPQSPALNAETMANVGMRRPLLLWTVAVATALRYSPGLVRGHHSATVPRLASIQLQTGKDVSEVAKEQPDALQQAVDAFLGDAVQDDVQPIISAPVEALPPEDFVWSNVQDAAKAGSAVLQMTEIAMAGLANAEVEVPAIADLETDAAVAAVIDLSTIKPPPLRSSRPSSSWLRRRSPSWGRPF